MKPITAFRSLIAAQWLLPLLLIGIELALPGNATPADVGGPNVAVATQLDATESVVREMVLSIMFLAVLATVSVGLWRFRGWATRAYWVVLVMYAAMVVSEAAPASGIGHLITWLDGVLAGAVAAWLVVARHTLPFPVGRSTEAG